MVIEGIVHLTGRLKVSAFATSFFVLGILTSMPEFFIGVNSIVDKEPSIFVGNLIGASFVLFMLVIPILAVFGKGITLAHQLNQRNLVFSLFVVLSPAFFALDGRLNRFEGLFMIVIYGLLFYFVEKKKGLLENIRDQLLRASNHELVDLVKIVIGALVMFLAGNVLVEQTEILASVFKMSPFLIGLLLLSIGTNIPELSITLKSISQKHKEVAFGDYVGSAAANTAFFGVLVLFNGSTVVIEGKLAVTFILFLLGLTLFYIFSRSKKDISRLEGIGLLAVYVTFLILEILR